MKISTKIIIPFLLLLSILTGAFFYLLFYLKQSQKTVIENYAITQRVNDISTRINVMRQSTDIYTLSYRFKNDRKYYDLIMQNQQTISDLLNEVRPLVDSEAGQQLLSNYENSRTSTQVARANLLDTIAKNNDYEIQRSFYIWQIESENSNSELLNFINYNLHRVERNELVYDQIISRIYLIAVFLILLTIGLILGLYYYLHRSISVPIRHLSASAAKISQGKFDTRIIVSSNDELGLLAGNLDTMAIKLKKYYRSIQNEVKKREEEIKRNKEFEEQKDNFMSVASHELRTPVTSLKAFGQLMQRLAHQNNHHQYYNYLTKMDEQMNKLTGLVSGLLDITKMQTGKMPYNMEWFDLNKCLTDNVEVAGEVDKKHQIILKGKVHKKVYGDADRICQVVENFISNALKYSPEGKNVIIKVSNDPNWVAISVQDFGIGIDKEHQERIFERFFRVSDQAEKTFPGLGIGLYVCAEIIKRHNGRIWVESIKEKGSTFHFSLPFKPVTDNLKN